MDLIFNNLQKKNILWVYILALILNSPLLPLTSVTKQVCFIL